MLQMIWLLLIFVVSLVLCPEAHAGQPLTLEEVVAAALANNTLIKEAAARRQAAEQAHTAATADLFPKAEATYGYSRLSEDPFMRINSQQFIVNSRDQHQWEVSLTQPVFTGFALSAQRELARLGIETRKTEEEQAALDVIQQAKQAYFGLLTTIRARQVALSAVDSLAAHEKDAESFFANGVIPRNDVLKSQVALADARQEGERAGARVKLAVSRLNTVIGKDFEAPTEVEDLEARPEETPPMDTLVATALEHRPEIIVLKTSLAEMDQRIRLAQSSYYPQVSLVGQYERAGDNIGATENEYSNSYNAALSVQARWTFFEAGKTRAEIARYHHEKQAQEEGLKRLSDAIRLEVKDAYLNLEVARTNIATARQAVEQAKENRRITNLRYQKNVTTSTEVLDAETYLTQAETNYYRALYGYSMARSDLDRAIGSR